MLFVPDTSKAGRKSVVMTITVRKLRIQLMPVTVQDYTWSETIDEVVIIIPLKGVKPSKADIFSSDDYVKVYTGVVNSRPAIN